MATKKKIKLSELAREVQSAVAWAEKQPNLNIDMCGHWFTDRKYFRLDGEHSSECSVCAAGAYWLKNNVRGLKTALKKNKGEVTPVDLPKNIREISYAMDSLRVGHIQSAMIDLNRSIAYNVHYVYPITSYDINKKQWHKDIKKMATYLEKNGL